MIHSILLFVYLVIKRINLSIVVTVRKLQKGKVFTSVCHSVHRGAGVGLSACWDTHPLPGQTPGGVCHSACRDTHPRANIPGRHPPAVTAAEGTHPTGMDCSNYRLQRSCEDYVFTGVCLSTGGGVCLSACWDTTPQEQIPQSRTPPEQTPPAQTPSRADTPQDPPSRHPPAADTPPPGADTPSPFQETATAVDGTHPTGMHSCYDMCLICT